MTDATMARRAWLDPLVTYFGRRHEVTLPGRCEGCGCRTRLAAFDAREWVALGPLPLFPLRAFRVFESCPLCRRELRLTLSEYLAWCDEEMAEPLAALQAKPSDSALRLRVAWRYYGLGRLHEALACLAPWLAGGAEPPAPAAAHHAAGMVLLALGRGRAAREALLAAVDLEPEHPTWRLDLGRILLRDRRTLGLAEHHLTAAARLAPDDPEAWLALAQARTRQRRWPEAWLAWQECLRRDPAGWLTTPHRDAMRKVAEHARVS